MEITQEERKKIKKPTDLYELLIKKMQKKRVQKDKILKDIDTYLKWYIPIISSIFFIIFGAIIATNNIFLYTEKVFIILGSCSLFGALLTSILARLSLFQYNKWWDGIIIRGQSHAIKFYKYLKEFSDRFTNTWAQVKELAENVKKEELPEEILKDEWMIENGEEVFEDLFLNMVDIFEVGLKKKLDKCKTKEERRKVLEKSKQKMNGKFELKRGWGRWAINLFYLSNVFFVLTIITWLISIVCLVN